jgi:hypothetical protein
MVSTGRGCPERCHGEECIVFAVLFKSLPSIGKILEKGSARIIQCYKNMLFGENPAGRCEP